MVVHLAVACDVLVGHLFRAVFFPRDVLDKIWNGIESVTQDFSYLLLKYICDLDAIIKLNILYVGYS